MHNYWNFSEEYQASSLQVLETALTHVPVYRSWQLLDPGPRASLDERYAALPALTKKDIREHFPRGILPPDIDLEKGLATGEVHLVETSGTTDDKVTNIWNQNWWDASEKASWKLNSFAAQAANGEHREAILANPRNVGFISDGIDLSFEKRQLSRFLYLNEKTDPTTWSSHHMDRMIAELGIYQPSVLEANPSLLARLSLYLAATGKEVYQPGIIVFTYEYPTLLHQRQIRQVFRCPLASSYGTTETGYVFMQCEEGHFHQNTEFCRVDFEPLQLRHGGPNLGRLLVTPLKNPWSYFLRFHVGDLALIEESRQCPCGRNSGFILSAMAGRVVNLTLTCEGRLVSFYELEKALNPLSGIEQYKLVQLEPRKFVIYLVSSLKHNSGLQTGVREVLTNLYGREADISVTFVQDIAPESSGKYLISRTSFPLDIEHYLHKKK